MRTILPINAKPAIIFRITALSFQDAVPAFLTGRPEKTIARRSDGALNGQEG
jgi:hypothetical protein